MTFKWCGTEGSIVRQDDWSLFYESGDRITQLFNTGDDDLIGAWRWRMWLDHKMQEGSARTGAEARETCERLLAEFQQAQMVKLPQGAHQ